MKTPPTMLTIDQTAKRAGVAKHFVRQLVINKKVVSVSAGNKYLVNWERFVDYLNSGDQLEPTPQATGKIRALYN